MCMDIFACVHVYILHVWLEPAEDREGFPPAAGVWVIHQESITPLEKTDSPRPRKC